MLKAGRVLRAAAAIAVAACAFALVPRANAAGYLTADEATSRNLVNSARAAIGLHPLADYTGLDQVARAQAVRMKQANDMFHNPNLAADITAQGIKWAIAGENVANGFTVESVHHSFMTSPEHYHNIALPQYNAIGVGIVDDGSGGIWVAHVFADIVTSMPAAAPATKSVTTARSDAAPVHHAVAPAPRPAARHLPTVVAAKVVSRPAVKGDPNALQHGVVTPRDLP